jgi:hypothetical protein
MDEEMTHILNLQGMDRWPMTEASETNDSQLLFSLVIFSPLKVVHEQAPSRLKITRVHALALEMFVSSFESKEDHDLIKAVMEIFPTVGIFMCVIADKKKQGKRKRPKARTIVDYPGVSCLCALRQCLYGGKKDEILKKQRCHNLLLGYEGSFFPKP